MISVGILCFAFVAGTLLSEYSYNGGVFKRIEDVIEDVTNEDDSADNSEDSAVEISYIGEYKENVICQGTDHDLTITTNKSPKEVATPVSLFASTDESKHVYDFDEKSVHYEAGTIAGTLNGNAIPDGTHYYIGIYQSYNYVSSNDWYETMVRYFILESKVYVLTGDIFYIEGDDSELSIMGELYDEENLLQETGVLDANVVILDSQYEAPEDCFNRSSYLKKVVTPADSSANGLFYPYFVTDRDVFFAIYENEYKTLAEVSGYTVVDSYNGLKILRNSNGKMILEDREGFVNRIEITWGWFENGTQFDLSLKDGTNSKYQYLSENGSCELNPDKSYNYAYENVEDDELEYVGIVEGNNVYQKKNIADDSYTKKLYEQDYVGAEYWKVNNLIVDDSGAISYEDFLTYHPVVYINDPYGYYIRLTNSEFYASGGCAKPAIYLYPVETTNISVRVIPNGRLVFTLPKYGDGWNVRVTADGGITNSADGKLYEYLWWDSVSYGFEKPDSGFIVLKSDVSDFLAGKLTEMNLNGNEISDFKEYWVPKLTNLDTDYVYISFLFNEEVDQIAKLEISPAPENAFRAFMIYKPVEGNVLVKPLDIQKANRQGYTLIEWGGAEI